MSVSQPDLATPAPSSNRAADPFDEALARSARMEVFRKRLWRQTAVQLHDLVTECGQSIGGSYDPIVTFRVENLRLFAQSMGVSLHKHARSCRIMGEGVVFEAIEPSGCPVYALSEPRTRRCAIHLQILRTRRRHFRDSERGYRYTQRLLEAAIVDVGQARARSLFLQAEREYWMSRCEPGLLQGRRQERAGIGWANLHHHALCCSRDYFHLLHRLLVGLGYRPVQVLQDRSGVGLVTFVGEIIPTETIVVEVDLEPHEAATAAQGNTLSPLAWRRRADLWCALHGESLLEGGLARLAGVYDCNALRRRLARIWQEVSDLQGSGARLSFTAAGQPSAVAPVRIDALERAAFITREVAERLRLSGAVATHLEGRERGDNWEIRSAPTLLDGLSESASKEALSKRPRQRLRRRIASARIQSSPLA